MRFLNLFFLEFQFTSRYIVEKVFENWIQVTLDDDKHPKKGSFLYFVYFKGALFCWRSDCQTVRMIWRHDRAISQESEHFTNIRTST